PSLDLRLHTKPDTILKKILEVSNMSEYYKWDVELLKQLFVAFPESEEFLIGTSLAEVERKGREEGKVIAKQESLLHFLKYKFSDIPTIILTMIEDNTDLDLLKTWTDIVFDNDDIEDIINLWKENLADRRVIAK
ncbi:MAG: hypothetical protein AAF639_28620, partial [Chloroflexota bacterium]